MPSAKRQAPRVRFPSFQLEYSVDDPDSGTDGIVCWAA